MFDPIFVRALSLILIFASRTNQELLNSGYCGCPGDVGDGVMAAFLESGAIGSEFIPICLSASPLPQFPAS